MTEKQQRTIRFIENELEIKHKGSSNEDALKELEREYEEAEENER